MAKNIKFLGKIFRPDIRKIGDLKSVVYDEKWLKISREDKAAYFMYRGLINKAGLRYDITIIPFMPFGQELPKTFGHYHSFAGGTKYRFPEVYEVLGGSAVFLLQKLSGGKITKVFAVSAGKGGKVVVPPGYGHITINAGPGTLKLANWMAVASSSDYKPFVSKKGGAYFALKASGNRIKWAKNKKYGALPKLERRKSSDFTPEFLKRGNLVSMAKEPAKLDFLKHPEKFAALWKEVEAI